LNLEEIGNLEEHTDILETTTSHLEGTIETLKERFEKSQVEFSQQLELSVQVS
jgi:hypothetical protein